jgi:polynucleotide 5'-hydroxyl-kinase GRC3/NOL9
VGQSTLGPPSTIGAKIFHKGDEVFGDDVRPPFLRFVGGTSPAGRIYACVTGARKALDWACENGAGLAVVDTTGLIAGEPGRELKTLKIDVLEPDLIIGISREAELDHILAPHERMGRSVVRLRRVEAVTARSPAVRQQFRLQKFQEYFKPSCLQELPLDKLVIADCPYNFAHHFAPEQIMSTQPALDRGVLLALLVGLETAGGQCLAVGIIKEFDSEGRRATVRAPKVDIDAVRCVRIGRSGIE